MKRNSNYTIISLFICLLILSSVALTKLNIGSSRTTSSSSFTIITNFYGANASEIERLITIPMEENLSIISGIEEIHSRSEFSKSRIDIQLLPDSDMNELYLNIRDMVDRVYQSLPSSVQKPQIHSSNSDDKPSYIFALSSDFFDLSTLRNHAEEDLKKKIEAIQGTGLIEIGGGGIKEIHIEVDVESAAQKGISIHQLSTILQQNNLYMPVGEFDDSRIDFPVVLNSRFTNLEDIKNIYIIGSNSQRFRLREVAKISWGEREKDSICRVNGEEKVLVYIHSGGNANILRMTNRIDQLLIELSSNGYTNETIYNEGESIVKKIKELFIVMLIEIVLVVLSLLVFGTKKQVLLISISIPLIVIFSLAIFSTLKLMVNQFILSGLAIGIGLMVDTGIVLTGYYEDPKGFEFKKIILALIGSTATTVLVLTPLLNLNSLIPGIRDIAISIIILIVVTLLFYILFIPIFYKKNSNEICKKIEMRFIKKIILFFTKRYKMGVIFFITICFSSIFLLISMNKDFSPSPSEDTLFLHIEYKSGLSPYFVDSDWSRFSSEVENIYGVILWEGQAKRGNGQITVKFNPKLISRENLIDEVKSREYLLNGAFIHIPGKSSNKKISLEIRLSGENVEELQEICRSSLNKMLENDWVNNGVLHFKENPPAWIFKTDQELVNLSKTTVQDIASALKWYIQGPVAMKFLDINQERDLRIMASQEHLDNEEALNTLPLVVNDSTVPVNSLGQMIRGEEPLSIVRFNKQRSHSFSIDVASNDLDELISNVQSELDLITLPPGYFFEIDRTILKERDAINDIYKQLLVISLLIFMLLASFTESVKMPLFILSILPMTFLVPLLILSIIHVGINSSLLVGFIILIGISVNNSILIMEGIKSTNIDKEQSFAIQRLLAVYSKRIRPLTTTTITTLLGSLPLAVLCFQQMSFSHTLALVTFLGMIGAYVSSIILLPSIIIMFYKRKKLTNN